MFSGLGFQFDRCHVIVASFSALCHGTSQRPSIESTLLRTFSAESKLVCPPKLRTSVS
jgi:hypothetical protein